MTLKHSLFFLSLSLSISLSLSLSFFSQGSEPLVGLRLLPPSLPEPITVLLRLPGHAPQAAPSAVGPHVQWEPAARLPQRQPLRDVVRPREELQFRRASWKPRPLLLLLHPLPLPLRPGPRPHVSGLGAGQGEQPHPSPGREEGDPGGGQLLDRRGE